MLLNRRPSDRGKFIAIWRYETQVIEWFTDLDFESKS